MSLATAARSTACSRGGSHLGIGDDPRVGIRYLRGPEIVRANRGERDDAGQPDHAAGAWPRALWTALLALRAATPRSCWRRSTAERRHRRPGQVDLRLALDHPR